MAQTDIKPRIGIIGGGLVGLTLGCLLAKQSALEIHIFEAKAKPSQKPNHSQKIAGPQGFLAQYDARSLALSSGGVNILKKHHLWPAIENATAAITKIQVSRQHQWGQTTIDAAEEGLTELGYVIETPGLARILESQLSHFDNLTMHWQANISQLTPQPRGYQITNLSPSYNSSDNLSDTSNHYASDHPSQQEIFVDLLIIADGERSKSCQMLGIQQTQVAYEQSAIVANIDLEKPLNSTAIERFVDQGVIALLPLNTDDSEYSHRAALVWVMPHDAAEEQIKASDSEFRTALKAALNDRLSFAKIGTKKCYPLSETQVSELIRPHLIVMGNAAHALHPIAAQGFNLSLRDIDAISDMIHAAIRQKASIGAYPLLAQYDSFRTKDQQRVSGFIKHLLNSYAGGPSVKMPRHLQSLGLFLFDILPQSKSQLARFAMGAQQPLAYNFQV